MPETDQQTSRRMGQTGLAALDLERACPGCTLYTPMLGDGTVYLLGLGDKEVHTWKLPHPMKARHRHVLQEQTPDWLGKRLARRRGG